MAAKVRPIREELGEVFQTENFTCPECKRQFSGSQGLCGHIKIMHGINAWSDIFAKWGKNN